ncbi:MAG: ATP-dependent 6-phosphofructokinase [Verrucomicrobia bacterium]|nr:ATP-dependent 6-phosphofructokinase [Verrucomicrobiota bacterium]
MPDANPQFSIQRLGPCRFPSPLPPGNFVGDDRAVLYHGCLQDLTPFLERGATPPAFEMAGPREHLYFDPARLKCGIVTCGGLCPGLNDVIRALVLSLHFHYGVRTVHGFRYGYEGLNPAHDHAPMPLTPETVDHIGDLGGTILGTSRGPQPVPVMVSTLERMGVGILFAAGGDGTLRGAGAIAEEAGRRNLPLAVIGIPKTIDNDISYVQTSFGFNTASAEAARVVAAAHNEARAARNGVALVKLMGRESGFIAAYAALASNEVNFCLVPEVPFSLNAFLAALRQRLERRGHAVITVAEGAGQDLLQAAGQRDASGNVRLGDIGLFLRDRIKAHFKSAGCHLNLKYIDPSYTIRSIPADGLDSAFCLLLGHNAVHAGMAGRTNMVVANWRNEPTHVPIPLATSQRKRIDPQGHMWNSVLASTGQPRDLR